MSSERKLLSELKVSELKAELEKRGLDNRGIKLILTDRLEQALRSERNDPSTFYFEFNARNENDQENANKSIASESGETLSTTKSAVEMALTGVPADGNLDSKEVSQNERAATPKNEGIDEDSVKFDDSIPSEELESQETNAQALVINEEATIYDDEDRLAAENKEDEEEQEAMDKAKDEQILPQQMKTGHNEEHSNRVPLKETNEDSKDGDENARRSLWVRNLPAGTKAAELKALFTSIGKVERAKIFTSKKQASNVNAFGFVTLTDRNDLERAIDALNRTEFKGRIISLERADKSRLPTAKANASAPAPTTTHSLNSPSTDAKAAKKPEQKKKPIEYSNKGDETKNKERAPARGSRDIRGAETRSRVSDRKRPFDYSTRNTTTRVESYRDRFNDGRRRVAPATNIRDGTARHYIPNSYRGRGTTARGFRGSTYANSYSRRGGPISQRVSYSHMSTNPSTRLTSRHSDLRSSDSLSHRQYEQLLQLKEQESRQREREMELQMERERLRFEKEKIERKRLELALLAAQTGAVPYGNSMVQSESSSRRSRERDHRQQIATSRHVKEKHLTSSRNSRDARSSHTSRNDSHGRDTRESHRSSSSSRHTRPDSRHRQEASRTRRDERSDAPSRFPSAYHHSSSSTGRVYETSGRSSYTSGTTSRDFHSHTHSAAIPSSGTTYGTSATLASLGGYSNRTVGGLTDFTQTAYTTGTSSNFPWPTVSGSSGSSIQARTTYKTEYPYGSSDLSTSRRYEYSRPY